MLAGSLWRSHGWAYRHGCGTGDGDGQGYGYAMGWVYGNTGPDMDGTCRDMSTAVRLGYRCRNCYGLRGCGRGTCKQEKRSTCAGSGCTATGSVRVRYIKYNRYPWQLAYIIASSHSTDTLTAVMRRQTATTTRLHSTAARRTGLSPIHYRATPIRWRAAGCPLSAAARAHPSASPRFTPRSCLLLCWEHRPALSSTEISHCESASPIGVGGAISAYLAGGGAISADLPLRVGVACGRDRQRRMCRNV